VNFLLNFPTLGMLLLVSYTPLTVEKKSIESVGREIATVNLEIVGDLRDDNIVQNLCRR
jgi:hypothetical protein